MIKQLKIQNLRASIFVLIEYDDDKFLRAYNVAVCIVFIEHPQRHGGMKLLAAQCPDHHLSIPLSQTLWSAVHSQALRLALRLPIYHLALNFFRWTQRVILS